MKKLLVLFLTIIMVLGFVSSAMASRIDVDYTYNKAKLIYSDANNSSSDSTTAYGSYAINDLWSANIAYSFTDDSDNNPLILGARYQLLENVSIGANVFAFLDSDSTYDNSLQLSIAANYPLNKQLVVAGNIIATQSDGDIDCDYLTLIAQAEYQINKMLVANAGLSFEDISNGNVSDDSTSIILGLEAYLSEQFNAGFDISIDTDDSDYRVLVLQGTYNF